jgi:glycosyltransferase involved in cell wall biosynthesis
MTDSPQAVDGEAEVTVLVPSYNHARFLPETLRSVLRQTHARVRLHVIDDGSTDDSVAVIEQVLAEEGQGRSWFRARSNRGCSATLNELLATVTTRFVALLNSDDVYAPDRLARMLTPAPATGSFFAISAVTFRGEPGVSDLEMWNNWYPWQLQQGAELPTLGFALLRANLSVSSSNFVFTRDLIDRIGGFRECLPLSQDWDYLLRSVQWVEPTLIPEPLLEYRVHPSNTYRRHRETALAEVRTVQDAFIAWAETECGNPWAPTPWAWPRFFPVFARACSANTGKRVGDLYPQRFLRPARERQPGAVAPEIEAAHLRRFLSVATRAPADLSVAPIAELAASCARRWAAVGDPA